MVQYTAPGGSTCPLRKALKVSSGQAKRSKNNPQKRTLVFRFAGKYSFCLERLFDSHDTGEEYIPFLLKLGRGENEKQTNNILGVLGSSPPAGMGREKLIHCLGRRICDDGTCGSCTLEDEALGPSFGHFESQIQWTAINGDNSTQLIRGKDSRKRRKGSSSKTGMCLSSPLLSVVAILSDRHLR